MPEIRSVPLDDRAFKREVDHFLGMLEIEPDGEIKVMCGWAVEVADQWEWISMRSNQVRTWMTKLIVSGVYDYGQGDLFICSDEHQFEVTICHESDIHVVSDAESYLAKFTSRWTDEGILWWMRKDRESEWTNSAAN
jgi:hypothetical protein